MISTHQTKQTIWDLREEKWAFFGKIGAVVKIDDYREIMTIKYPSGFTWELHREDFPTRNLIPVYAKDSKGKYYIDHYDQGQDAVPSPSLERILKGEYPQKSFLPEVSMCPDNFFTDKEVSA